MCDFLILKYGYVNDEWLLCNVFVLASRWFWFVCVCMWCFYSEIALCWLKQLFCVLYLFKAIDGIDLYIFICDDFILKYYSVYWNDYIVYCICVSE